MSAVIDQMVCHLTLTGHGLPRVCCIQPSHPSPGRQDRHAGVLEDHQGVNACVFKCAPAKLYWVLHTFIRQSSRWPSYSGRIHKLV